ncbi:hypothetical protein TNCV_1152771 [Trichonephila clavipes]|nr:hypothetical protein TNCV_1152771 [Trichonephila clavipes]
MVAVGRTMGQTREMAKRMQGYTYSVRTSQCGAKYPFFLLRTFLDMRQGGPYFVSKAATAEITDGFGMNGKGMTERK